MRLGARVPERADPAQRRARALRPSRDRALPARHSLLAAAWRSLHGPRDGLQERWAHSPGCGPARPRPAEPARHAPLHGLLPRRPRRRPRHAACLRRPVRVGARGRAPWRRHRRQRLARHARGARARRFLRPSGVVPPSSYTAGLMSRFHEPQHPDFVRMNPPVGFDRRLWPQDIAQSRAHAKMLAAREIISAEDRDELLQGLDEVQRELEQGQFVFVDGDEDIHMAIERHLTELVGAVGGKLHTARSRNDQVATDLVMYTRERAREAQSATTRVMGALLERAEQHIDWALPGYTHLQRAQPVYLGHHLLAYFWMLARDRERFAFAERQCSRLPLGAGALAGVNFDTDRELVARELGFDEPVPNSIDAVANRDFALDYLSAAATCATHLSPLGGG